MSFVFYFFFAVTAFLFLVFAWSLRSPKRSRPRGLPAAMPQDLHSSQVMHFPQIRQALAKADYEFVSTRVSPEALRRMRRDRLHVGLAYLSALRGEFDRLLQTARVIAALSPEVAAAQELERMRLTLGFYGRYRIIWMSLWLGYAPLPQMNDLSNLLSGYSVRLEAAMKELGERAALVGEIVSSADRRRVNPV